MTEFLFFYTITLIHNLLLLREDLLLDKLVFKLDNLQACFYVLFTTFQQRLLVLLDLQIKAVCVKAANTTVCW